jgi:hypothetical protein
MSHGNEMICQPVTLSGYAEWPQVADTVIEAGMSTQQSPLSLHRLTFLGSENETCKIQWCPSIAWMDMNKR